jgi:ABC-type nickel/cobalt efflux system permease component RcnA
MTFAITRGVPAAGVAFAIVMMIGVAVVLSEVAIAAVLFRKQLLYLLSARPRLILGVTRAIQIATGATLVMVALNAVLGRYAIDRRLNS